MKIMNIHNILSIVLIFCIKSTFAMNKDSQDIELKMIGIAHQDEDQEMSHPDMEVKNSGTGLTIIQGKRAKEAMRKTQEAKALANRLCTAYGIDPTSKQGKIILKAVADDPKVLRISKFFDDNGLKSQLNENQYVMLEKNHDHFGQIIIDNMSGQLNNQKNDIKYHDSSYKSRIGAVATLTSVLSLMWFIVIMCGIVNKIV